MTTSHQAMSITSTRAGIYVASRASIPERAATWRFLRDRGAPIISTWIDESGPDETRDLAELWTRIEREIAGARRLVLLVEPGDLPLKGAYIEVGMALMARVPVVVVAPDVELDARTLRPLGSWVRHPLVSFKVSLVEALTLPPEPQEEN